MNVVGELGTGEVELAQWAACDRRDRQSGHTVLVAQHFRDVVVPHQIDLAGVLLLEQVILNLVRNAAEAVQELPKTRRKVKVSVSCNGGSTEV